MSLHRQEIGFQGPTCGDIATRYGDLFCIVTHPAFRLGFLDALAGKPIDHDHIADRIVRETPASAIRRLGISAASLFDTAAVELAQYRYEEGRIAVIQEGLKCRAWGHPYFPPAQVRQYIWARADKTPPPEIPTITLPRVSSAGPLFEARA